LLSTSAARSAQLAGSCLLSSCLANAALFMMYEGIVSIMGLKIISKYIATIYVTQPMLAQIERTGGARPGISGEGEEKET
jgi:hypothetical protein